MSYSRTSQFIRVSRRRNTLTGSPAFDGTTVFQQADTKSGQRVEKWREKISRGDSAGSPYSRTAWKYSTKECSGFIRSYLTSNSSVRRDITFGGVIHANQNVSTLTVSSPEDKALTNLYNAIREAQSAMNGMLILGELRETLAMLRRPGRALLELFSDYCGDARRQRAGLRAKGVGRKRIEKAAAGLWLEYSFGWKPLISDVRSIATAAARIATDNALRTTRAKGVGENSNAQVEPPFTSQDLFGAPTGPIFWNTRKRFSSSGVRYVAGLRASLYGPTNTISGVARETGFTLDNFVPTIWNLIPYSFLVDYFTNIGNCIDAVFTDTSAVNWYVRTARLVDSTNLVSSFDSKAVISTFSGAGYTVQSLSSSGSEVEVIRTILARTVGVSLPIPGLTLSYPGIDSNAYWNMLALFKGKAQGLYRP